jgi:hypothetical protein
MLQVDEGNVERVLLLVDIADLGDESPYDLLQLIKPVDDVAHGGRCLLP